MSEKPRYVVDSHTGHRTMSAGGTNRKSTTTWTVYDRGYLYRPIASYDNEHEAREHADALNLAEGMQP